MPAAADRPALSRCIAVPVEVFVANHWSQRPLLSPADELPERFSDLLDLSAVDELLSRRGLRTPFLRMAKDGKVVEPSRFTSSGGAGAEIADQVSDDKVLGLFADGCTMVLQGLHRVWPPLIDFASQLAAELGHPVQVNAYITPPESQGFSPHYDVHDVFVLQVAGEKRWLVHEPVRRLPTRNQPWTDVREDVSRAAAGEPVVDTVLRPGDSLYLPRGYVHSAQALGDVSAHLTVGIHPITRAAIVEALLGMATDNEELRTSLPVGWTRDPAASVSAEVDAVTSLLAGWLPGVDRVGVTDDLLRREGQATRPAPVAPLVSAAAARAAGPDTVVRLRPQLRTDCHVTGGRVRLRLPTRELSLPEATAPAVALLLTGGPVRVADLPGLDADDQLVLARRLLRDAVVVPDPPAGVADPG